MTERDVRAQLAAYLEELDDRAAPPAPEEPGTLRKVLLPAALGASMLLTAACEATPIALPYMGPMPDGYFWDYRVDGPLEQGTEAAPDQGPADAAPEDQRWRVKVYLMENDPEKLLKSVAKDFPEAASLVEKRAK